MKKRFLSILVMFCLFSLILSGCTSSNETQLEEENEILQEELDNIKKLNSGEISQDNISYIIVFEISQSHFTLDLSEHLKDMNNKLEFPIEVSKKYYNSVEIGETVKEDFRVGSLIFKGSFGNWIIKIKDKQIVNTTE